MGSESGETLHSLVTAYVKQKYNKPGNAYLGVVSRLDMMTSGVIVFARTSKAASRLVPQFGATDPGKKQAASPATKIYIAAIEGRLDEAQQTLVDQVYKDDNAHRMRVAAASTRGAQRAELQYVRLAESDDSTVVAVRLLSGRKHQIRVQFAERGHPIIGDRKYGCKQHFPAGITLHSWCLQITHPTRQQLCTWYAELPASWKRFKKVVPSEDKLIALVNQGFGLDLSGR